MQIESVVKSAQGGAALNNLAAVFGIAPDQAETAAMSMLADLANRVERKSLSNGGLADVIKLLGNSDAGRALFDAQSLSSPGVLESGNGILELLTGSKHVSRGIAGRAASISGIDTATAQKLLPVVASMLTGSLQKETQSLFAEQLKNVDAFKSPLPLPGEGPSGNDGWDIAPPSQRGGGDVGGRSSGGRSPLPIPGDNIPGVGRNNRYDDLSDVIRRGGAPGGTRVPVPSNGSLGGLIRSILGSLLGFGNRGIMGTLFQLFLVRVLPALLRRLLSRR